MSRFLVFSAVLSMLIVPVMLITLFLLTVLSVLIVLLCYCHCFLESVRLKILIKKSCRGIVIDADYLLSLLRILVPLCVNSTKLHSSLVIIARLHDGPLHDGGNEGRRDVNICYDFNCRLTSTVGCSRDKLEKYISRAMLLTALFTKFTIRITKFENLSNHMCEAEKRNFHNFLSCFATNPSGLEKASLVTFYIHCYESSTLSCS